MEERVFDARHSISVEADNSELEEESGRHQLVEEGRIAAAEMLAKVGEGMMLVVESRQGQQLSNKIRSQQLPVHTLAV